MSGTKNREELSHEPLSKNERIQLHTKKIKHFKRRQNRAFLAVLFTAALVCIAVLAVFVFFRVDNVRIEGDSRYTELQITDASGIEAGSPMLLLSKEKIEERIITSLVYIGTVEVKKELTGVVVLTVRETTPAFYAATSGGFVLFDSTGKVLEYPAAVLPEGCAEVRGLEQLRTKPGYAVQTIENERFRLFLELLARCEQAQLGSVTGADFSDLYDVRLTIDNAFTLSLGTGEDLADKLAIAAEVIEREGAGSANRMKLIDLSSGSKAYVRDVEHTTAALTRTDGEESDEDEPAPDDASDEGSGESQPNGDAPENEEDVSAFTTLLTAEG